MSAPRWPGPGDGPSLPGLALALFAALAVSYVLAMPPAVPRAPDDPGMTAPVGRQFEPGADLDRDAREAATRATKPVPVDRARIGRWADCIMALPPAPALTAADVEACHAATVTP